jgi:uncharacterized coiled-coil DUF342 family protein
MDPYWLGALIFFVVGFALSWLLSPEGKARADAASARAEAAALQKKIDQHAAELEAKNTELLALPALKAEAAAAAQKLEKVQQSAEALHWQFEAAKADQSRLRAELRQLKGEAKGFLSDLPEQGEQA